MVIKMMMRFDDMTNMKNHDGYDQDPTVTKSYSKSIYALIANHSELHSKVFNYSINCIFKSVEAASERATTKSRQHTGVVQC